MSFLHPHLLWLLAFPAFFLVAALLRRQAAAAADTHPKILRAKTTATSIRLEHSTTPLECGDLSPLSPTATSRRTPSPSDAQRPRPRSRGAATRYFLITSLAAAILALARPQYGLTHQPVFNQAREILIAVDLSPSMLAADVKPSRLDRARLLITDLLEKLRGERVGLIVFSGTAFLQSPLSTDYEILREFLPLLTPDLLPQPGTNYDALLAESLSAFSNSPNADRFLIILSDGEAHNEDWRNHIQQLKTAGIRVLSLGIGTPEGAMITQKDGSFLKDPRGAVVLSRLQPATLRELATATDGEYRDASLWVDLPDLIAHTIEKAKRGEFLETSQAKKTDRYQYPLALSLLLLLISLTREFPTPPKPRKLKLTP